VLHRIVLSLRSPSHGIRACFPFRDALLFPEDVEQHGGLVSGAFRLDLIRTFELEPPPGSFVAASIGAWVSEVVVCA
jgi:hypothetical protein